MADPSDAGNGAKRGNLINTILGSVIAALLAAAVIGAFTVRAELSTVAAVLTELKSRLAEEIADGRQRDRELDARLREVETHAQR